MRSLSSYRASQTCGRSLPGAVLGVVRGDIDIGDFLLDHMQVLSGGEGSAGELLHFTYAYYIYYNS